MHKTETIICDIDGCIFKQQNTLTENVLGKETILPGVLTKFNEWEAAGHTIILVTGRKESCREQTEKQLRAAGLFWDHLIMGVGSGPRHLINDNKPDGSKTAFAYPIERNKGLTDLKLNDGKENKNIL